MAFYNKGLTFFQTFDTFVLYVCSDIMPCQNRGKTSLTPGHILYCTEAQTLWYIYNQHLDIFKFSLEGSLVYYFAVIVHYQMDPHFDKFVLAQS